MQAFIQLFLRSYELVVGQTDTLTLIYGNWSKWEKTLNQNMLA